MDFNKTKETNKNTPPLPKTSLKKEKMLRRAEHICCTHVRQRACTQKDIYNSTGRQSTQLTGAKIWMGVLRKSSASGQRGREEMPNPVSCSGIKGKPQRCCCAPARVAHLSKAEPEDRRGRGWDTGTLRHGWWGCELVRSCWETVKKLTMKLNIILS